MTHLVTFHSVGSALYAEKLLVARTDCGSGVTVVPVPRSVSSSCGYAVETNDVAAATLTELLDNADVEWDVVYHVVVAGGKERYEPAARRGDGERNDG